MRTASALILLATLEAACSSGGPLKVGGANADPTTLPKSFAGHIESQWKGASVVARVTSPCAPASASGSGPQAVDAAAFVTGDFDGDGFSDVAAPVKRGDGLHVVAGLRHTYEYTVMDVIGKPDDAADRLTVRPRGTLYKVPGSDVDYYFGADTIVLAPCSESPTAFLWTGSSFDPQPLAK